MFSEAKKQVTRSNITGGYLIPCELSEQLIGLTKYGNVSVPWIDLVDICKYRQYFQRDNHKTISYNCCIKGKKVKICNLKRCPFVEKPKGLIN